MAARSVQIHCVGDGLEAKTLKLTLPPAWATSPCSRLLKAVAKRCGGVDAADLALETARGAAIDADAPIASTAGDTDLFVRRATAKEPAPTTTPTPMKPPPECAGPRLSCPVFVVTLESDADRVAHAETYARARLPEAELFPAVDGRKPGVLMPFLKKHAVTLSPAWASSCTVGQLGCMCSHIALWRRVLDESLPHAAVLEDDVLIADGFRIGVTNALAELPKNWDHCYLFYHPQCFASRPLPGASTIQRAFETWGTVAYLVSAAGARKLLDATTGRACSRAVDETIMAMVRENRLDSYCVVKPITGTDGQINPEAPDGRLGSNVWGSPKLAPP